MGKIDSETKDYVKRPEVFADLFNYFMYDGKKVIKPEDLSELDTTEIFIPFDKKGKAYPVQKYRDILKNAVVKEDAKVAYAVILGVENQTDIHYAMPVRNMGYDAYNYAAQVDAIADRNRQGKKKAANKGFLTGLNRDDKILPVVTLVVYFGQKPWDGPMSLHEMLTTTEESVLKFVPDYKMNLIAPVSMNDEDIEKFSSNFRELAAFIKCGSDKQAMNKLAQDERFRHLDPKVATIANNVTKSGLKIEINEKGEVDMCVAIAGIKEDAKAEGRAEGRAEGEDVIVTLMQKLFAAGRGGELERASKDSEYRKKLMKEFGLS